VTAIKGGGSTKSGRGGGLIELLHVGEKRGGSDLSRSVAPGGRSRGSGEGGILTRRPKRAEREKREPSQCQVKRECVNGGRAEGILLDKTATAALSGESPVKRRSPGTGVGAKETIAEV